MMKTYAIVTIVLLVGILGASAANFILAGQTHHLLSQLLQTETARTQGKGETCDDVLQGLGTPVPGVAGQLGMGQQQKQPLNPSELPKETEFPLPPHEITWTTQMSLKQVAEISGVPIDKWVLMPDDIVKNWDRLTQEERIKAISDAQQALKGYWDKLSDEDRRRILDAIFLPKDK
jgi:hypothetical protein